MRAEADCVAAHYRVVAEPDGAHRFVGLSALERGLDKDLKFFELDAAGNKARPPQAFCSNCHSTMRGRFQKSLRLAPAAEH